MGFSVFPHHAIGELNDIIAEKLRGKV